MKAIEATGLIDKTGVLKLDKSFSEIKNKKVKVIILVNDSDEITENSWLKSINNNPAFDFLSEPEENIYSTKDGKPYRN